MTAAPIPTPKQASKVPLHRSILRRVAAGWIVFRYEPGKQVQHPHPAFPKFWQGGDRWVGSSTTGAIPEGTLIFETADSAREAREESLDGLDRPPATTEQARLFA
jgi:hypothetical protein